MANAQPRPSLLPHRRTPAGACPSQRFTLLSVGWATARRPSLGALLTW